MNETAIAINAILLGHKRSSGMVVSMGATCECGYWTGNERAGVDRPAGIVDALNWHRAVLIAELLKGDGE